MRSRRKHRVQSNALRAVLSETLPFELPSRFSNGGLYRFLVSVGGRFEDGDLIVPSGDPNNAVILRIIFGGTGDYRDLRPGAAAGFRVKAAKLAERTIPINFMIRKNVTELRQLSVPHPSAQIAVAAFYSRYRGLLLLHSSKSSFSVRRPSRIARYTVFQDHLFSTSQGRGRDGAEQVGLESARLRSYFVYSRFAFVHRFHDSEEYRRAETHFSHMLKLDIQQCFDSVYTHSIQWAIHSKKAVKADLKAFNTTFAGNFDALMQSMNDGETHGILIGPEVSRIFAEIILQAADVAIEKKLEANGFINGRDYLVQRYVDDYFIFLTNKTLRDPIVAAFQESLKPFRFNLNFNKEDMSDTPHISQMSIGKHEITSFLESAINISHLSESVAGETGRLHVQTLARRYKTILNRSELEPSSLVNYSLAELERCVESKLDSLNGELGLKGASHDQRIRKDLGVLVHAVGEFGYYIYSGGPRVVSAIKVARLVVLLRGACDRFALSSDVSSSFDDMCFRETTSQLERFKNRAGSAVENLYLLAILAELPEVYRLKESSLCEYFGIERNGSGNLEIPLEFSSLAFAELLRYLSSRADVYSELQKVLESWLIDRVTYYRAQDGRHADEPILVLDSIACPSISDETKWKILRQYGVRDRTQSLDVAGLSPSWFTDWTADDLYALLDAKRTQEVY